MDQKTIEDAFGRMSGHEGCAQAFRSAVWREIRHRKALGEKSNCGSYDPLWLICIRSLFPGTAVAGLAIAVTVAWAVGSVWSPQPVSDRTATTSRVLDLGVFEPHAEGWAHSKLMVNR